MKHSRRTKGGRGSLSRAGVAALGILAASLTLAACGSSSSSSNSSSASSSSSTSANAAPANGVSAAINATVARSMQPITKWPGPNVPAKDPGHKNITVITCSNQGVTCVRVANGVRAAAKVLGWSVTSLDGQNTPSVWNSTIRSAVADKTQGIVLAAVAPNAVPSAVNAALKAGIPVASVLSTVGPATSLTEWNLSQAASWEAAWVTKASKGKAQAVVMRDPSQVETQAYDTDLVADLKKDCSGCKVVAQIPYDVALVAQKMASTVSSALESNPSINYILLPYDQTMPFVEQGVRMAGRSFPSVQVAGTGGDPPSILAIKGGVESGSLGTPAEWMGWMAVDSLVRHYDHLPLQHPVVPEKMITKADIAGSAGWQGDFDYQAKYKALWGR